ncbi:MAG: hypothetical protein K8R87_01950 [Verrucomicrobia bacterium]|nr:hypothetical protein [Verrucomicrobiota bacterium]
MVLGTAYTVLGPTFIGCGSAWVTVRVRAIDAVTKDPIPAATVTLISEFRTKTPDMLVNPPTVLTAETDKDGYATVKDMFGAGFDNTGTSIGVGTSSVRCQAPGYLLAETRLSPKGRLRFTNFLIYKQPSSIELSFSLKRQ